MWKYSTECCVRSACAADGLSEIDWKRRQEIWSLRRADRQAIAGDARSRILGARLVVANPDVAVLATVGVGLSEPSRRCAVRATRVRGCVGEELTEK